MSAPDWLLPLLGWKPATVKSRARCVALFGEPHAPNLADVGSEESLRLAGDVYRALNIRTETSTPLEASAEDTVTSAGTALEIGIEKDIARGLAEQDTSRNWIVRRGGEVSQYAQFKHLSDLQRLVDSQPTLRATLGRDYQVRTDVYVGVAQTEPDLAPFLHAAISCKWTIRSDRVQNVRHEFATLVRNRRGRLPHLVLVTAEPLPSRLVSIARGTGEVDAVYHLLFDELDEAVQRSGSAPQRQDWAEMIQQSRLKPYGALAEELTLT